MRQPHRGLGDAREVRIGLGIAHHGVHAVRLQRREAARQRAADDKAAADRTAAMHALERQREKLLANDVALTDLLAQHPDIDVQQLRTLIRNARKEAAEGRPPKSFREIFKVIRDAG